MAWPFKTGSFRGVPFYVEVGARSGGRALVAHELPQGTGELWEDLGPDAELLSFDAYLVTPHVELAGPFVPTELGGGRRVTAATFYQWRDDLLAALEKPQPGTLIHPTFGSVWARARRWSISDSRNEQGFVRLQLEFVRDRELEAAAASPDRDPNTEAAAGSEAIYRASGDHLEADLATESVAERARLATETELRNLSRKLRELDRFFAAGQQAADLARQASRIARDVKALVVAPAELVASIVTAVRDVQRAARDIPNALAAYESLLQLVPSIVNSPQEDANTRLVNGLIRGAALAGALRVAVLMPWESYEQAIGTRDRLLERLAELEPFAADAEFEALAGLRVSLVRLVPPEGEQLPRVSSFTPPASMPAILAAWRLYADPTRDAEIVARNRVPNPNFLQAGRPLEVLVDAAV